MRHIIFGNYNTETWGLTLTSYKLAAATPKTSFVDVPGADGAFDLSTINTDGEPRYHTRKMTATFELSSGTRDTRLAVFSEIVNALHGRSLDIVLPDDPSHYLTGRLTVNIDYCDPAHGALTIEGVCQPWRLATTEKTTTLTCSSTLRTTTLTNGGTRLAIPVVAIEGTDASVELRYGTQTWTLSAGTYHLPDLILRRGANTLKYKGVGTATLTWREAVL